MLVSEILAIIKVASPIIKSGIKLASELKRIIEESRELSEASRAELIQMIKDAQDVPKWED